MKVMDMQLVIFIGGLALSVIGFFLIKFYNSVERLNNGVNRILISMGKSDEAIREIKENIHELKLKNGDSEKRLRDVEIKIAKIN